MRELLGRGEQVRIQSQGRFDYSIKGRAGGIAWDATHAWRTHPDAHLGFGAIGKGYALDRARAEIEAHLIELANASNDKIEL
jgi:thiamine biosynthesis lipoprotein ApbE